jgi:hypothetical protein
MGYNLFDNTWPPKDAFPELSQRISQQHYQAFIAHANDHGLKPYIQGLKEVTNGCATCCAYLLCPLGGCCYLFKVNEERNRLRDELEQRLKECMEPFQQQVLQYANIRGQAYIKAIEISDAEDGGTSISYYPCIEFKRLDSGGPLPASAPRPPPVAQPLPMHYNQQQQLQQHAVPYHSAAAAAPGPQAGPSAPSAN